MKLFNNKRNKKMNSKLKISLVVVLLLVVVGGLAFLVVKKKSQIGNVIQKIEDKATTESTKSPVINSELVVEGEISEEKLEKRIEDATARVEAESDPEKKQAISKEEGERIIKELGL